MTSTKPIPMPAYNPEIVINDGDDEIEDFQGGAAGTLGPKLLLTTTGGNIHDVNVPIPVEDDREVVRRASLAAVNQHPPAVKSSDVPLSFFGKSGVAIATGTPPRRPAGEYKEPGPCDCCSLM